MGGYLITYMGKYLITYMGVTYERRRRWRHKSAVGAMSANWLKRNDPFSDIKRTLFGHQTVHIHQWNPQAWSTLRGCLTTT